WLSLRQKFISKSGNRHYFILCISELKTFQLVINGLHQLLKLVKNILIFTGRSFYCRNFSVEVFMCQYNRSVYKIPEYSYKLSIISGLKIFPCKLAVFGFRGD